MADTRLSDRSAAGALSASDLFYVVQTPGSGGEKATGAQLLTLVGTTYVPLAGGTMTGALTLPAGAVGTPQLMFTGAGATTGLYSSGSNNVSIAINGVRNCYFEPNAMYIAGSSGLVLQSTSALFYFGVDGLLSLSRDAAATLALRNGTTQQIFRLYNSYTDSSNFERLTLTGVAGTSVNITAETLGTGGDNLDIVLTPAGTGAFRVTSHLWSTAAVIGIISGGATTINYYTGGVRTASTGEVAWTVGNANASVDAALMRNAAGVVEVNNGTAATYRDLKLRNLIQTAYHEVAEMTAPAAPATNSVRIYAEDNGSGKTRLMALFATGAAQQIAIEP